MTEQNSIPNKSHFTFDEVALITGVKKYVLRFWETEFDGIRPVVSSAGQKLYEHKDINAIFQIKKLLFDQKLPIEKAKAILSQGDSIALAFDDNDEEGDEISVLSSSIPSTADTSCVASSSVLNVTKGAKEKLQAIIDLADSLKKRHNWR